MWGVQGMQCATEMLGELRDRAWRRSLSDVNDSVVNDDERACHDTYTINRLVYYVDSAIAINKLVPVIPPDVIADLCAALSAALVWSRWEIDLATYRRFNELHEALIRMLALHRRS
jgi:hypothetical protein